jgi:hypothetical protein
LKQSSTFWVSLLLVLFSEFVWADHAEQIDQVRIDGSKITVYGRFFDSANTRVTFGAEGASYPLLPRVTNSSVRAIELQLPFQPVPGQYRLTLQEPGEAELDLAITIGDDGVSAIAVAIPTVTVEDAASVSSAANSLSPEIVDACRGAPAACDSPSVLTDGSPFCDAVADFDPFRGSQAMTIDGTQELYLDESFTIEARVFTKGYVRSGILVDKYSGNARGREYRLSINREGLLRAWFSVDGTLNHVRALYSNTPVPKDQWVHVASTFDGQVMRLYIDGVMAGEEAMRGRPAQLGYQNIAIGGNNCCDGYYEVFNGLIDDVRISSTVRYSESFTPPTEEFVSDNSTLLLLPFDESGKNFGVLGGKATLTDYNRIVPCSAL